MADHSIANQAEVEETEEQQDREAGHTSETDASNDEELGPLGPNAIRIADKYTSYGLTIGGDEFKRPSEKKRKYGLIKFRRILGEGNREPEHYSDSESQASTISMSFGWGEQEPDVKQSCTDQCIYSKVRDQGELDKAIPRFPRPATIPDQKSTSKNLYTLLETDQFRMIRLLPGEGMNPIKCALVTIRLSDLSPPGSGSVPAEAQYEALSYAWGDPTPTHVVSCNETLYPIAENLHTALWSLRKLDKIRCLWADAICINQHDIAEKNSQIRHMLTIYEKADKVIVWLGQDADDSMWSMAMLTILDHISVRHEIEQLAHSPICYENMARACRGIQKIMSRPWFTRTWIRQEIMGRKKLRVQCGQVEVKWYNFKRSSKRLGWLIKVIEGSSDIKIPSLETTSHGIEMLRMLCKGWKFGDPIIGQMIWLGSWYDHHAGDLLELLLLGRKFESTDPRDRVYSVLGMAKVPTHTPMDLANLDGHPETSTERVSQVDSFLVDYSMSVSHVYQSLAKYVINRDRNLDILFLVQSPNATDLPSWTPDWRHGVFNPNDAYLLDRYVDAAGKSQAELQNLGAWDTLLVTGWLTDVIASIDEKAQNPAESKTGSPTTTVNKEADALNEPPADLLGRDESQPSTELSRLETLDGDAPAERKSNLQTVANRCDDDNDDEKEDRDETSLADAHTSLAPEEKEENASSTPPGSPPPQQEEPFSPERRLQEDMAIWRSKAVEARGSCVRAKTRAGRTLFVPPLTQSGDAVWLLQGGKIHFVLRQFAGNLNATNGGSSVNTELSRRWAWSLVGSVLVNDARVGEQYHFSVDTGREAYELVLL